MFTKTILIVSLTILAVTSIKCDITVYDSDGKKLTGFQDVAFSFGARIPSEGIEGYILPAIPFDGCTKIDSPPKSGSWFALIMKGNCNYEVKVRNAQNSNYTLAIVFNVDYKYWIRAMRSVNSSDIVIPSVLVDEGTGLELRDNYNYANKFYVIVDNVDSSPSNYPRVFFAMVGFVMACLAAMMAIALLGIFIYKCCIDLMNSEYSCKKNNKTRIYTVQS